MIQEPRKDTAFPGQGKGRTRGSDKVMCCWSRLGGEGGEGKQKDGGPLASVRPEGQGGSKDKQMELLGHVGLRFQSCQFP